MKLLIVYNAQTGFVNQSFDWLHKVVSPSTYSCSLCQLTHGSFGAKDDWKNFINKQSVEVLFFHKNEFNTEFPSLHLNFPWIGIMQTSGGLETVIDHETLHHTKNVSELIYLIEQKLNQLNLK